MILKRKVYNQMLEWKKHWHLKRALLVEGQRRVGKSTSVEEFAKKEYKAYILCDFSEEKFCNDAIFNLVSRDKRSMDEFFRQLFVLAGRSSTLPIHESAIIFDEIQFYPKARQAIKFLVADGRYDYIETGSLVSIKSKANKILIPSEERSLKMYPLDFEEFLINCGENLLLEECYTAYEKKKPLLQVSHQALMKAFRHYLLIGGMPQAVVSYLEKEEYGYIDEIKRDILKLYRDDIEKEDEKDKILSLFNNIPSQLTNHQSRFILRQVDKSYKTKTVSKALHFLDNSMITNRCFDTMEPTLAMPLAKLNNYYRIYPSDIGLYLTQLFEGKRFIDNTLYGKLLFGDISINEGTLMETYVSQQLTALSFPLYYHTFNVKESTNRYEVDFLITKNNKACPIEVKSTTRFSIKSLEMFLKKYKDVSKTGYVISPKNFEIKDNIIYLPLYMTYLLGEDE